MIKTHSDLKFRLRYLSSGKIILNHPKVQKFCPEEFRRWQPAYRFVKAHNAQFEIDFIFDKIWSQITNEKL